jgi:hypothetical protein
MKTLSLLPVLTFASLLPASATSPLLEACLSPGRNKDVCTAYLTQIMHGVFAADNPTLSEMNGYVLLGVLVTKARCED